MFGSRCGQGPVTKEIFALLKHSLFQTRKAVSGTAIPPVIFGPQSIDSIDKLLQRSVQTLHCLRLRSIKP